MQPLVYILLATRNGERFLSEQFESLLAQTEPGWRLLIRDDGSTDGTAALLERFAKQDERVEVLKAPDAPGGSAAANFGALFSEAFARGADYALACDQDDVWLPEKLTTLLREIRVVETDSKGPALVHHDLQVVDENLETLSDSYWRMMHLAPGSEAHPYRLLSRNEVTGCASICNRALLELALPIPGQAIMHDWWLALCAAFLGRLRYSERRLVRYRQHSHNVIGARPFLSGLWPRALAANWSRGNLELQATIDQARAFRDRFEDRLFEPQAAAVDAYATLLEHSPARRLLALNRSRAWRGNGLLDTSLVLRLLTLRKAG